MFGPVVGAALRNGVVDWRDKDLWELGYMLDGGKRSAAPPVRDLVAERERAMRGEGPPPDPINPAAQVTDRNEMVASLAALREQRARRKADADGAA